MKRLALALALFGTGCSGKERPTLHVLIPDSYVAKDTVPAFEKEFACAVTLVTFDNAEDLRTKLGGGRAGYDVVVPSDEVVGELVEKGLIVKLDRSAIPNFPNVAPAYRGLAFDPKNEYTVPYQWGTTGIAYNREKIVPPPDSWGVIWDAKWSKRSTLLDDRREVFAAAMRLDGADPGQVTLEAVRKAAKRFEGWKPIAYETDPKQKLTKGDVWISQCYSGDALQASRETGGKIAYVIPKEGATRWIDSLAIPKGAPHPELAHRFIDYLLRPEVCAAICNERFFGSPNEPALKLIQKEVLDNRMAYPSPEEEKRLHVLPPASPEVKKAMNDAWDALRSN